MAWYVEITNYLPSEHEGQYGYRWFGMGKSQITHLVNMKRSMAVDGLVWGTEYLLG